MADDGGSALVVDAVQRGAHAGGGAAVGGVKGVGGQASHGRLSQNSVRCA